MILAFNQLDAVLNSGDIILWISSNVCPSGYTKIISYYGKYLYANNVAASADGASHNHTGISHYHSNPTGDSGSTSAITNYTGTGSYANERFHSLPAGDVSTETGFLSSTNPVELSHVKVVLCKKD
jgi:hypothetical protein